MGGDLEMIDWCRSVHCSRARHNAIRPPDQLDLGSTLNEHLQERKTTSFTRRHRVDSCPGHYLRRSLAQRFSPAVSIILAG